MTSSNINELYAINNEGSICKLTLSEDSTSFIEYDHGTNGSLVEKKNIHIPKQLFSQDELIYDDIAFKIIGLFLNTYKKDEMKDSQPLWTVGPYHLTDKVRYIDH
jgi:hypothetical protein